MKTEHPTHQVVHEAQPGDGVDIDVRSASQAGGGRGSRHVVWILLVSFVLALAAMGGYWASIAKGLDRADKHGQPYASGQQVTDRNLAGLFRAPEPAPKQPPTDDIAASSGPAPTNVPLGTGQRTAAQ
jgi:hypothetical protein